MDVEAMNMCKGARYQNLWWVEEPIQQVDRAIHFWICWEELHAATVKVPPLSNEAISEYQRIARFSIGPHTIDVQAHRDPDRQWLLMSYKVTDEELEATTDEYPTAWHKMVSTSEVSVGLPKYAPNDPV